MAATTYKWSIKTDHKLEQASKLIKIYCVLNNINPSDTTVLVCAYILLYGLDSKVKEVMLKAGVRGTMSSLQDELGKIKRMGLIETIGGKTRISQKIVPLDVQALTPQTLIIVNLDNR